MAATLKKLESKIEILRSENEVLKKEATSAKSRNKFTSRKTIPSVVRRLNMDEAEEWDQGGRRKRRNHY